MQLSIYKTNAKFDYTIAWAIEALFELFFMECNGIKKASAESATQLNTLIFFS